jgi:hypothetical protein
MTADGAPQRRQGMVGRRRPSASSPKGGIMTDTMTFGPTPVEEVGGRAG